MIMLFLNHLKIRIPSQTEIKSNEIDFSEANGVNGNITALEKRIEALEKNQIGIMGKLLALDNN